MDTLKDKNVVVIGGSRGVGRAIVAAAHASGARVLAVARRREFLDALAEEVPGILTLAADAAHEATATQVRKTLEPDVLVLCGGALPPTAPVHEQTWEEFSRNWDSDVRASFLFCREALRQPLRPGSVVILVSSGAALGGSPISGGYAAAKRAQMFLAQYCEGEATRLSLGVRFFAVLPQRIMPDTDLGKIAVAGYARYLGLTESAFLADMDESQTPDDVARAVIALAAVPGTGKETAFVVSAHGVEALG